MHRRFSTMLSDGNKIQVVQLLFFIQSDIRLNQLATDAQVQELWDSFREDEVKVDFLHGASQELRFLLGAPTWKELIDALADAYTINYESCIDLEEPVGDDVVERMAPKAFLQAQFTFYPWLVVLFLIDLLNLDVLLGGNLPEGFGE